MSTNRGERGPHGDHGFAGETGPPGGLGGQGAPGERGPKGDDGTIISRGERGPHGDHGQDGIAGDAGPQGETGRPGETGRTGLAGLPGERGMSGDMGLRGQQGVQGAPADEQRVAVTEHRTLQNVHRLTFLFAFIILALILGGYLLRRQNSDIRRAAYESCVARNVAKGVTNKAFSDLAAIDRRLLNGPGSSELQHKLADERTAAYAQAQIAPESCGKKP